MSSSLSHITSCVPGTSPSRIDSISISRNLGIPISRIPSAKCLAWEWGPYHINVNAIAPGYTHSNLSSGAPKEVEEMMTARIPYGRYGEPIEIGALAVYLASDASDIMTGAILTIDGGYSLAR